MNVREGGGALHLRGMNGGIRHLVIEMVRGTDGIRMVLQGIEKIMMKFKYGLWTSLMQNIPSNSPALHNPTCGASRFSPSSPHTAL